MQKKTLCMDCFFFEHIPTKDPKTGATIIFPSKNELSGGFCRRYPPTVMKSGEAAVSITRNVDWCGEAVAKEIDASE